ncbi:MAG TPA: hypothetical protein VF092_03015 [Longimicrobium sp.]
MPTSEINSREYKLLLSTTRFHNRDDASKEWMGLVARVIERAGGTRLSQQEVENEKASGKPEPPDKLDDADFDEKRRSTSFLDTRDNGFRNQGWILRVRQKKKDKLDLTVKFRSPDRLLAASKDASATQDGDQKFEEDIVPPFTSQYSRSNTLKDQKEEMLPKTVGEAAALFPALQDLKILGETELVRVDDLVVTEVVRHVGGFRFGSGPRLEMSHTFWYVIDEDTQKHYPMVAEFSFEFEAKDGDFPLETVRGASEVYRELQAQAGWLDVAGTTKSAIVAGGV